MSVILILLAITSLYLLKILPKIWDYVRILKFIKSLKGPSPFELRKKMQNGEFILWLKELRTRFGSTFYIWIGKDILVFLTDAEDLRVVLGSQQLLYKSNSYKTFEPWLGRGLLTNGGELWHIKRKMLAPAFHFKILGEFKQSMDDNCDIMIEKLKEKANGEAIDIHPFVALFALDVICETAMGIQKNAQLQSQSEYVTAVKNMCRIAHKQGFSWWKRFEFLFRFSKDFKERQHALDILHGETNSLIKMRRSALKASNITSLADAGKRSVKLILSWYLKNLLSKENIDENGIKKRLAFLDILLLSQMEGADLTDLNIREEVDTFMFGGYDTTSSAISFALYLLSQHKAEQQIAFEEAVALKGKEKEQMKYLEAVIKESLRLYPPVPLFSRKISEDISIRDLRVPKGVIVCIFTYALHRDEKYYPEPERFNPERFLVDENKLHPFAFVPFSAGPRNCIGQKFAMLEIKCVLAKILRNFELLPVEGFAPVVLPELVTKSANGLHVRLKKR